MRGRERGRWFLICDVLGAKLGSAQDLADAIEGCNACDLAVYGAAVDRHATQLACSG